MEPFRAIGDRQQPFLRAEPALHQPTEERRTDAPILRGGLDEAKDDLPASRVTPTAVTIPSSAKVFPSITIARNVSLSSRRSSSACTWRALARMNRRETEEALSPKAAGTASAHRAYSRVASPPSTRCSNPVSSCRGTWNCGYVARGTSRLCRRSRTRGTVIGSFWSAR